MIEPMENIPVAYSKVKIVDATKNFQNRITQLCKAVDVKHTLKTKNEDFFDPIKVLVHVHGFSILRLSWPFSRYI